jgi:hypothetical protein
VFDGHGAEMSEIGLRRPTAVWVIGCAGIGLGLFVFASGVVTAFDWEPIFPHQTIIGIVEVVVALCLVAAASALLRLRVWGARVIQSLALLLLVFFVAFGTIFICLGVEHAWAGGRQGKTMIISGIGVTLFYAIPLVLVVRSLGSIRRRGRLR